MLCALGRAGQHIGAAAVAFGEMAEHLHRRAELRKLRSEAGRTAQDSKFRFESAGMVALAIWS